jgi:hypothetical protein
MARPLRAHCRASNFAPGEIVVHDDLAAALDQRVNLALAGKRLHHGDVDLARGFALATTNGADDTLSNGEESVQAFLPLPE